MGVTSWKEVKEKSLQGTEWLLPHRQEPSSYNKDREIDDEWLYSFFKGSRCHGLNFLVKFPKYPINVTGAVNKHQFGDVNYSNSKLVNAPTYKRFTSHAPCRLPLFLCEHALCVCVHCVSIVSHSSTLFLFNICLFNWRVSIRFVCKGYNFFCICFPSFHTAILYICHYESF